ncbi:UDP-N-acetylglucosamine 2-epimerase [Aquirufa nivalisilvae]
MRIGVLTSSRADYGIYLPLLNALFEDVFFSLDIIAFGTHLSKTHGHTVDNILNDGFSVKYKIETTPEGDTAFDISHSMALTSNKFSLFWEENKNNFDIVFCLGDRYEMFSAVSASIPFNIKLAHIHGGEKTLGAIDNVFRHSISHASILHFASNSTYTKRLTRLLDNNKYIYNIGSLSLENLNGIEILSKSKFQLKWGIDLNKETVLLTFHPETVEPEKNILFANELVVLISSLSNKFQFLITMPNADTNGNVIREKFNSSFKNDESVFLVENLGLQSYFSAMKHCVFLLGNTSSGIIEAASFGKYVINIGNRQKGRSVSKNVLTSPINSTKIKQTINSLKGQYNFNGLNIYFQDSPSKSIIDILKQYHNNNVQ